MPAPMVTCTCCNRSYEAILMVKCSVCKKSFKNTCVDISANEVRVLNANKGYDWSCLSCREFGNELKDLKALILKLQADIQTLKAEKNEVKPISCDADFEEILGELNERKKRQRNLVLFGVTELNQDQGKEALLNSEKSVVVDILHAVLPELNVANIKPIRLGSFNHSKNRPIKVTLESETDVINLVRQGRVLRNSRSHKGVFLATDSTPRQQQYFKKIKGELNERRNAGETDIKIKFFRGIPKIVSVN